MKRVSTALLSVLMIFCMVSSSFAGTWKQDDKGYWYVNDDGTYPTNCWKSIDSKEYYFGADGYLLVNCVTPDGFTVDVNGEKVIIAQTSVASISQNTESASSASTATPTTAEVYITATGKKYHAIPNCGSTDPSRVTKGTVQEAQRRGLEPCRKCY